MLLHSFRTELLVISYLLSGEPFLPSADTELWNSRHTALQSERDWTLWWSCSNLQNKRDIKRGKVINYLIENVQTEATNVRLMCFCSSLRKWSIYNIISQTTAKVNVCLIWHPDHHRADERATHRGTWTGLIHTASPTPLPNWHLPRKVRAHIVIN